MGVRRTGHRARDGAAVLEDLVVLDAVLVRALRRAGRAAARLGPGDAGSAATVEADAEQQLLRRDAERLQLGDRGVGVEALRRDARVGGRRGETIKAGDWATIRSAGYGTAWEMIKLRTAVRLEQRTWKSIRWNRTNGDNKVVEVFPERFKYPDGEPVPE